MASEMRVSCVLCASHACARGGVPPPPLPCVCSAVEPPLSILRGRSPPARGTRIVFLAHRRGDHTCRGVLPQGGTAWRGAERLGLSWLVRAARELPWVVDSTTTSTRHRPVHTVSTPPRTTNIPSNGRKPVRSTSLTGGATKHRGGGSPSRLGVAGVRGCAQEPHPHPRGLFKPRRAP